MKGWSETESFAEPGFCESIKGKVSALYRSAASKEVFLTGETSQLCVFSLAISRQMEVKCGKGKFHFSNSQNGALSKWLVEV